MLLQLDLPEELNRQLKIYKAKKGLNSLEVAAIQILSERLNVKRKEDQYE